MRMSPQEQVRPGLALSGRDLPLHISNSAWRRMLGGALALAFVAPISVGAFRLNDSSSVSARPGSIIIDGVLLGWVGFWLSRYLSYRKLVLSSYAAAAIIPFDQPKVIWARRVRWVLAWLFLALWTALLMLGKASSSSPDTITVSPWLGSLCFLAGIGALILSAILPKPPESEAYQLESARLVGAKLGGQANQAFATLSERISKRIVDLQDLHGEISSAERKRELIQREVDAEKQALYREVFEISSRRDHRRQWGFVIVSFLLGFVVNWLSAPAWHLFHRLHF
jgi:hypothetical protein